MPLGLHVLARTREARHPCCRMAAYFDCPYLHTDVELTDEREAHIAGEHPEINRTHIAGTLEHPDRCAAKRKSF